MEADVHKQSAIVVGDLFVEPGTQRIVRGGADICISKLSFDLLLALTRAAPDVVSIDELIDRVWSGLVVSHETVTQRIKLLRDALGDDAHDPRYVALVRGRGYRLIAPVKAAGGAAGRARPRFNAILIILLGLLALSILALGLHNGVSGLIPGLNTVAPENSLAVLPFDSESPEPASNDFLAAAIHDDLLTQLAKIPSIKVVSRFSVQRYADQHENLRQVGRELGVTNILEGSVRRVGQRLHINVQLIDAIADQHLWAETYDREYSAQNILAIQADIARSIAWQLHAAISRVHAQRIAATSTSSTRALTEYLHGQALFNEWKPQTAENHFRGAIAIDHGFALAHAALARMILSMDRQGMLASPERLKEAYAQALMSLDLSPDLAEGHLALGYYYYYGPGDFQRALTQVDQAELQMPGSARVHAAKGFILKETGHWQEAIASLEAAIRLDPGNPGYLGSLSFIHMYLGQYDAAESNLARALSVAPSNLWVGFLKANLPLWRAADTSELKAFFRLHPNDFPVENWMVCFLDHDFVAARAILKRWPGNRADVILPRELLQGLTDQYGGRPEQARIAYASVRRHPPPPGPRQQKKSNRQRWPVPLGLSPPLAVALAGLGEKDAAIDMARRALQQMPKETAPWRAPPLLADLAAIYAMTGEDDQAIAILENLSHRAWAMSMEALVLDPRYDHLRDRTDFRKLLGQSHP